jgi:hypothetical protein
MSAKRIPSTRTLVFHFMMTIFLLYRLNPCKGEQAPWFVAPTTELEDPMNEYVWDGNDEIDCEVSVYEGSWATCDMVVEDKDKEDDH